MPIKLLKIKEVMLEYGIGEKTVENAVKAGELPIYKLNGKTYYYRISDIENWIDGKRVKVVPIPALETTYDRFLQFETVRKKHGRTAKLV